MRITEFRSCRCGYSILIYVNQSEYDEAKVHYIFFDGHSGNYEQTFVCPGCHDRLDYFTLEG